MSTGYQIKGQQGLYYLTFQVIDWIDLFTQKQYAFVFTNNLGGSETQEHVIAHEIAHGTFNLRHTFSTENTYTLSPASRNMH